MNRLPFSPITAEELDRRKTHKATYIAIHVACGFTVPDADAMEYRDLYNSGILRHVGLDGAVIPEPS